MEGWSGLNITAEFDIKGLPLQDIKKPQKEYLRSIWRSSEGNKVSTGNSFQSKSMRGGLFNLDLLWPVEGSCMAVH